MINHQSRKKTINEEVLHEMISGQQLDRLHLSLVQLLDMANEGELDLILDQPNKTKHHKELFLRKVVDSLSCPELQIPLRAILREGNTDFFSRRNLVDWAKDLEHQAEAIAVIKLTVAIPFESREVRQFIRVLSRKMGRPVALEITTDPSLIGGVVIQHGNYLSDYSLKSRLDQFRSSWQRAVTGK